jgi:hypothetical protein
MKAPANAGFFSSGGHVTLPGGNVRGNSPFGSSFRSVLAHAASTCTRHLVGPPFEPLAAGRAATDAGAVALAGDPVVDRSVADRAEKRLTSLTDAPDGRRGDALALG